MTLSEDEDQNLTPQIIENYFAIVIIIISQGDFDIHKKSLRYVNLCLIQSSEITLSTKLIHLTTNM